MPGTLAPTNICSAAYPQVLPGNCVVFRVNAPEADKVQIDLGREYDLVKVAVAHGP